MILLQLFWSFFQIGLLSFGGGYAAMPLILEQVVTRNQWLTMDEFADIVTIAEMTPGPIAVNSATFVGTRLAGIPGAVLCTMGCILPSFFICLILAHFYYKYRGFSGVQTVLSALRPAVVALIASAGLSILLLALFQSDKNAVVLSDFQPVEGILFAGALFILRKYKVSAIAIIFGTGVIGTILYLITGAPL